MLTVTGYSYKGGTGRTLLMANLAMFAAQLGNTVVAIDFDLEAPGLPYKFPELHSLPPCPGLVGWLGDTLSSGEPPSELADYCVPVAVPDPVVPGGSLTLMPAGSAPSRNYFQALRRLRLGQRLDDGTAIDALVELQRQIAQDLGADLLLIDSRTGITSSNTVTTHVLADVVVALTLRTPEQLAGTRSVLRSLQPLRSIRTDEPIDLHVVVSRVPSRGPVPNRYEPVPADEATLAEVSAFLAEPATPASCTLEITRPLVLHTDHGVADHEHLLLAASDDAATSDLYLDYWRVAEAVLQEVVRVPAEQAVEAARIGRDPDLLEQLGNRFADPALAEEARGLAVAIESDAIAPATPFDDEVEELRHQSAYRPGDPGDLAAALIAQSRARAEGGGHASAIAPAEEAVRILRRAVDGWGGGEAMADALLALSSAYADVGRKLDAVGPADEAVMLLRSRTDPTLLPTLARALDDLGVRLSEVGDKHAALLPTQEAVELSRGVAQGEPDHLPHLARSLRNLGIRLSEVGDPHPAVAAIEESAALYRTLAATDAEHLPGLARVLITYGNRLDMTGDHDGALAATGEALDLYRPLANANPNHLPGLAMAVNNLGVQRRNIGDHDGGLAAAQEALDLYRPLANANPNHLPGLARALDNLGVALRSIGDHDGALAANQQALDLYRPLASANPNHLPSLALALDRRGIHLSTTDERKGGLAATQEALDLYRSLADANRYYLPDLARTLGNLAFHLSQTGDEDGGLAATQEALELYRPLADANPNHLPSLARTLGNLAVHLGETGDRAGGLVVIQEALDLYRPLADANPNHLPSLARTLDNLGLLTDPGDVGRALAAHEEAVAIYRALTTSAPVNLPGLERSLQNLSHRLASLDRDAEASAIDQELRQVRRQIADLDRAQKKSVSTGGLAGTS